MAYSRNRSDIARPQPLHVDPLPTAGFAADPGDDRVSVSRLAATTPVDVATVSLITIYSL